MTVSTRLSTQRKRTQGHTKQRRSEVAQMTPLSDYLRGYRRGLRDVQRVSLLIGLNRTDHGRLSVLVASDLLGLILGTLKNPCSKLRRDLSQQEDHLFYIEKFKGDTPLKIKKRVMFGHGYYHGFNKAVLSLSTYIHELRDPIARIAVHETCVEVEYFHMKLKTAPKGQLPSLRHEPVWKLPPKWKREDEEEKSTV